MVASAFQSRDAPVAAGVVYDAVVPDAPVAAGVLYDVGNQHAGTRDISFPAGTREAGKRLISFYSHAARGGVALASKYLDHCHLRPAFSSWAADVEEARRSGLLRFFKLQIELKKQHFARCFRDWHEIVSNAKASAALAVSTEIFARTRACEKLLKQLRLGLERKRLAAAQLAEAARHHKRTHVARWQSGLSHGVESELWIQAATGAGATMRKRHAFFAWFAVAERGVERIHELASRVAPERAAKAKSTRDCLRVWRMHCAWRHRFAFVASQMSGKLDSWVLADGFTCWRRYLADLDKALDRRWFDEIAPLDPVAEVRRYIAAWRHRKRVAFKVLRKQQLFLHLRHARRGLWQWHHWAGVIGAVREFTRESEKLCKKGLALFIWNRRTFHELKKRRLAESASVEFKRRIFRRTMEGLRERIGAIHLEQLSRSFARSSAWNAWCDAADRNTARNNVTELSHELHRTSYLGFGLTRWKKHADADYKTGTRIDSANKFTKRLHLKRWHKKWVLDVATQSDDFPPRGAKPPYRPRSAPPAPPPATAGPA